MFIIHKLVVASFVPLFASLVDAEQPKSTVDRGAGLLRSEASEPPPEKKQHNAKIARQAQWAERIERHWDTSHSEPGPEDGKGPPCQCTPPPTPPCSCAPQEPQPPQIQPPPQPPQPQPPKPPPSPKLEPPPKSKLLCPQILPGKWEQQQIVSERVQELEDRDGGLFSFGNEDSVRQFTWFFNGMEVARTAGSYKSKKYGYDVVKVHDAGGKTVFSIQRTSYLEISTKEYSIMQEGDTLFTMRKDVIGKFSFKGFLPEWMIYFGDGSVAYYCKGIRYKDKKKDDPFHYECALKKGDPYIVTIEPMAKQNKDDMDLYDIKCGKGCDAVLFLAFSTVCSIVGDET